MPSLRITAAIAIAACVTVSAFAQQKPPQRPLQRGTSTLRGRVLDNVTKAPIAGCTVRAAAAGFYDTRVSGDDGAYEFKDIAAGNYFFIVQCEAHLRSMCSDPNEPLLNMCSVDLIRDQQREEVNFRVIPGAIARGYVVAFDGRPMAGAKVRVGRGIHGEATPPNEPATTDAKGRFELKNLAAGEWRFEVEIPTVPGGLTPPVVYYPGGLSWEDAAGVELIAGKITDNLTITVPRINENTLIVSVPPPDATISQVAVSVLQQSPLVTRRLTLNDEGVGTLKAILPGRYFALALASSGDRRWAGFEVIDFIEDTYEARLQLQPTGSIAGKIVGDRGAPPNLDGVIVGASWVHDGAEVNPVEFAEARVAADGSFRIDGLFGTRKLQLRALGTDWELAAVRQDRTDVTESGIVIVPDATIEATIVVRRRGALYD